MNTIKEKTAPWFHLPCPKDMKPLEQVACMVWLAENHTLEELRQKQSLITRQLEIAQKKNMSNYILENIGARWDNITASIAYQTFKDINTWMAFIND